MLTRAQARTQVQYIMDAYGSGRWDTTAGVTGEMDRRIGIAHMREWKRILNAHPTYRLAKRQPAANSDGKFAISDLSVIPDGDTAQRLYRIHGSILIDDTEYKYRRDARSSILRLETDPDTARREWWREGDYLSVLPAPTAGTVATIWVNHTPQRFDRLGSDGITVVFVEDYEEVYLYHAAALLLAKGGAETDASAECMAIANTMRDDMLQDIARISTDPTTWEYSDSREEWAG